jgi:voltage-gated potassium channel Kch
MGVRPAAMLPRRIERILTSRHVVLHLISTTIVLVLIFGVVIHLVDEEEFPSVWVAMWWAIGTVTTVGYGDIAPAETSGRLVASALMIVGIAFLSLVTATVASALVSRASGEMSEDSEDLPTILARIEERLDRMERRLGSNGSADA